MTLEELQSELLEMIQIRMASHRTLLDVQSLKNFSISELRFYSRLLRVINTKESQEVAQYIDKITKKAIDGTFQLGD